MLSTKNEKLKRFCTGCYTYRWFVIQQTDDGSWAYGTQHENLEWKMAKRFGVRKSLHSAKKCVDKIMNKHEGN